MNWNPRYWHVIIYFHLFIYLFIYLLILFIIYVVVLFFSRQGEQVQAIIK